MTAATRSPSSARPCSASAYFAPSTWAADNASDLDLGSTQPVLAAGDTVFIMGKRGVGYLLNGAHLGGIGGQLAEQSICAAFGTAAVSGSMVYEPCNNGGGLAAVQVSAANKTIKVLWRGPAGAHGSPVVGGGAVWVTHYPATAARCTSSTRRRARSSTRSRSARACRTSPRWP